MKRNFMLLCVAIATSALLAFTLSSDSPYEHLLPEKFKTEFVKQTTSVQLRLNLADVYSHDFDFIESVDLHQSADQSHYYVAYGQKNNQAIVQMINVSDEWAAQQLYPNRIDMGIGADEAVINCYCVWFICSHKGRPTDKVCGVALDTTENCKPAFCTFEAEPIELN